MHGREIRGEDSRATVWGYHRRRFRELVRRVSRTFGGVQTGEERIRFERRDKGGGIQGCRNGSGGVLHRRARPEIFCEGEPINREDEERLIHDDVGGVRANLSFRSKALFKSSPKRYLLYGPPGSEL